MEIQRWLWAIFLVALAVPTIVITVMNQIDIRRARRTRVRGINDPNFLFSLPPFVTGDRIQTIVVEPTGRDDTPNLQAAANRLLAIGGGTLRFSAGDFFTEPFYVDDSIRIF